MTEAAAPFTLALAELQALQADQRQPLRWAHLQALHRRAQAHHGLVREMLDARLARAVTDCRALLAASPPATNPATPSTGGAHGASPGHHGSHLSNHLSNHLSSCLTSRLTSPMAGLLAALQPGVDLLAPASGQAPPDLKVLRHFRPGWARQRLDRQIEQSLARVPDNAGPLNTQRLLLQALGVMREVSPDYLQRLLLQVDTLRWIEQAALADAVATRPAPQTAHSAGARTKYRRSGSRAQPGRR